MERVFSQQQIDDIDAALSRGPIYETPYVAPVLLGPDGRPIRMAADARCPRCGAGAGERVPACGFGKIHDLCARCGHAFEE